MICEDPVITVSLGTGEEPLVISSSCEGEGISWTELALPDWSLRMKYAPPSDFVAGNVLLSAVEDSGEIVMAVGLEAASIAALEALKTTLRTTLLEWPGSVTVTLVEDAVETIIGGPWQSFPTLPRWGEVRGLLSGLYYIDGFFSLPVNPTGAP